MFSRVLVANRGEIAVRVIRALHELGIEAVSVYLTADADAMHVALADQVRSASAARAAPRRATEHPERRRGRRQLPAARRYIPATGSSPRTRRSCAPARTPGSSSSGQGRT